MLAVKYPTSPAESSSQGSKRVGRRCPTSTTLYTAPVAMSFISMSLRTRPSMTRMSTMTPRKESYWLSNTRALSGASASPFGAGTPLTISSSTAGMLMPFLAEISGASMAGMPMMSSISVLVLAVSAAGRSILFMTGSISRSWFMAR